jgi:hypothetical protein
MKKYFQAEETQAYNFLQEACANKCHVLMSDKPYRMMSVNKETPVFEVLKYEN